MGETIELGKYKYTLELDTNSYTNGMKEAMASSEGIKGKLSSLGDYLKGNVVAGVAAAGAAVAAVCVKAVKDADDLKSAMNSFSAQTGIAGESAKEPLNNQRFQTSIA